MASQVIPLKNQKRGDPIFMLLYRGSPQVVWSCSSEVFKTEFAAAQKAASHIANGSKHVYRVVEVKAELQHKPEIFGTIYEDKEV